MTLFDPEGPLCRCSPVGGPAGACRNPTGGAWGDQSPCFCACHVEPVVLDAAEGRRLAREGLERSEDRREALRAAYDIACEEAARGNDVLCSDQVWEALGWMPTTKGERSAMGGAMIRARKRGLIEPTGDYRHSERPDAHRKPLPLYRSLVR